MTKEQMEKGFQLERHIIKMKKNLNEINEAHNYLNGHDQPRVSIVAPDLSRDTALKGPPESIEMDFMLCALPNNFFQAYACNLEIEIQRLENQFKNL